MILCAQFGGGAFLRFQRHARRAGEHAVRAEIHVHEVDALVAHHEFAHLVRVRHAARFQHVDCAVALAVELYIAQQQPRIHERGYAELRILRRERCGVASSEAGEERGDLLLLQEINEPHERRLHLRLAAVEREIADRIDDHDGGPERQHRVVHHHQMLLQPVHRRARTVNLE